MRIFLNPETACQASEKLIKSDRFSNVGVLPSHLFELELFFLDKNEILLQYRFHNKLSTQLDSFSHRRTQRNPREQLAVEGTIAGSMFYLLEHAQSEIRRLDKTL